MNFDWKATLRTVAPTIATALGGPLAGVAASTLSTILLGKPDGSEADLEAAIATGGSDALLKAKEAEIAFKVRMRELDIDIERIHQQDRTSAREREAKTGDSWTPRVLAGVVVGGFLAMVYMVLSGYVEGLKDPVIATTIGTLIGYTSAKADQVVSYYFGSSAGSKEKTEILTRK